MREETLRAIARNLQAAEAEIAFLKKLEDGEGELLARLLARLEIHAGTEHYAEAHWEDD